LYEFPLIETEKEEDWDYVNKHVQDEYCKGNTNASIYEYSAKSILHKLSHQHLHIKFWNVQVPETLKNGIDIETLRSFPFPIVIHNFIEKELQSF
jgi:A/G-specific adenine glycosylase